MSKQWTDADVARMLGWRERDNGLWLDVKKYPVFDDFRQCACLPEFGLSTPPSPEADANAARYVLPWLRSQSMDTQEWAMNALIEVWIDSGQKFGTFSMWTVLCMDGPTLCTAALEAYHTGTPST